MGVTAIGKWVARARDLWAVYLIRKSGPFDADYYLAQYKDVCRTSILPITHYVFHGAAEGRNANPVFDTRS